MSLLARPFGRPGFLLPFLAGALLAGAVHASVDEDWQKIEALDAGPRVEIKSRAQARTITLAHLASQEKAIRDFLENYPDDSRSMAAKLRLAHLLAVRGELDPASKGGREAARILDELEKSAPPEKRADVAFAKIALVMAHIGDPDESASDSLLKRAEIFEKQFPGDRRVPPLLVEVAGLFDSQPAKKKSLLEEARTLAADDDLKQRIEDDLKRIALLDKPVQFKFRSVQGREIDLAACRGKIVLIYFFANFSPPSLLELKTVREIASLYAGVVCTIGVSLDENRQTLLDVLKANGINWPVAFDGKGWESPLVRSLGINTLPTIWILDENGILRTLNARKHTEETVRQMLSETKRHK